MAAAGADTNSGGLFLVGILFISVFIIFAASPIQFHKPTGKFEPTRYEVTIKDPNYVIDATKYNLVETKGKILVLEEVKDK